jgi:glutamate-5-semialdehyde dehydrogenase
MNDINTDIPGLMDDLGRRARAAAAELARSSEQQRYAALGAAAASIFARQDEILAANALDMQAAEAKGLAASMLDRLLLDEARVKAMSEGIRQVAELDDPVGQISEEWLRPNGLVIQRVRVPLGVIGIIYESRPMLLRMRARYV